MKRKKTDKYLSVFYKPVEKVLKIDDYVSATLYLKSHREGAVSLGSAWRNGDWNMWDNQSLRLLRLIVTFLSFAFY